MFSSSGQLNFQFYDSGISSFPGVSDVWFSLNGTIYQNNSNVTLENIGVGDDAALLCRTEQPVCCQPHTGAMGGVRGNWYFPNGTRVLSSATNWDMYRTRDHMVVLLHRRRGGVDGIYHCEIPDAMNVTRTIYIGVYTASTGEWDMYIPPAALPYWQGVPGEEARFSMYADVILQGVEFWLGGCLHSSGFHTGDLSKHLETWIIAI